MAEEQRNKRPLTPSGGETSNSSKRTVAPRLASLEGSEGLVWVPVKLEPQAQGQGGLAIAGRGSRPRSAAAKQTSPAVELRRVSVSVALDRIHCNVAECFRPLVPPIFKCEAGHRLCSTCRGDGHCRRCDRATAFVHCGDDLDADVGDYRVPCPYESYGCDSSVVYHDVAAHQAGCTYAPCPCPAPGCAFSASPPTLRGHLAAGHGWRLDTLPGYGRVLPLRVPASEPHRVLAVDGDAARLFLLSVRLAVDGAAAVSVSCVRSRGAAEAGPRYRCKMWAEAPGTPASEELRLLMEAGVANCPAAPGGGAVEEGMELYVPPPMLRGPSKEIHLRLRIDVVDDPAAATPRTAANASSPGTKA